MLQVYVHGLRARCKHGLFLGEFRLGESLRFGNDVGHDWRQNYRIGPTLKATFDFEGISA